MYKNLKVAIVTGGYNEEGKVTKFIPKIPKFVDEIVFTDDASTDKTVSKVKQFDVTLFVNKKNSGAGSVLRRGFNYILKKDFDVIVVVAGDNQDKPSEISGLLDGIVDGADFVQGSRYINHKQGKIPLFRKITTTVYSRFAKAVLKQKITDSSNGFRAIRTSVLKKIKFNQDWLNRYELEPFVLIEAINNGFKYVEVPVTKYYDRKLGYSKMIPIVDWYRMLKPFLMEIVRKKD